MPSHTKSTTDVTAIGIDIGKTTFHLIGQDRRGKIVMRARVSRSQLVKRLANVPDDDGRPNAHGAPMGFGGSRASLVKSAMGGSSDYVGRAACGQPQSEIGDDTGFRRSALRRHS